METTAKHDPMGRYDVFFQGAKVGEIVKGIYYEGPPNYQQRVGVAQIEEGPFGLTMTREDGTVFMVVPQGKA